MVLADTSVWIDHFRSPEPALMHLIEAAELLMHPFVLGELATGSLANRQLRLRLWAMMPSLPTTRIEDVLALVESRRLYSRGIGYPDANLLASTLAVKGTLLWTRDGKLQKIAREFEVSAELDT